MEIRVLSGGEVEVITHTETKITRLVLDHDGRIISRSNVLFDVTPAAYA